MVEEVTAQNSTAVGQTMGDVRELLDRSRDGSPVAVMRRELMSGFTGPLQQMVGQLAAVHAVTVERSSRARTPADGVEYELVVGEILNEAATVSGDSVMRTGAEAGIGTSKVGDHCRCHRPVGRTRRFVVEAEAAPLGKKTMLQQLNDAAQNRDAVAAILVTSTAGYGWKKQPHQKVAPRWYVVVAERHDPLIARGPSLRTRISTRSRPVSRPASRYRSET